LDFLKPLEVLLEHFGVHRERERESWKDEEIESELAPPVVDTERARSQDPFFKISKRRNSQKVQ
jgi:hypothetical protein